MSVALTLPDGAAGEALSFEGETLHVVLPRAFAPGAPLTMSLALVEGAASSVRAKTQYSKRREDGRFDVRLRVIDLRREDRERLTTALAPR